MKSLTDKLKIGIVGLSALGITALTGCATTSEYASASSQNYQKSCAIVDSESAFRCMKEPQLNEGKILFIGPGKTGEKYDVFTMNNDGTELRNLTNSPDIDEDLARWTYNGKIAYMEADYTYINNTRKFLRLKDRKVMNEDGTGVITISPEFYNTVIKK